MRIGNKKLVELFDKISNFNKTAYFHRFVLANNVLSKSTFGNNLAVNFINKKTNKIGMVSVFFNIIYYYIKSSRLYALLLLEFLVYNFSRQRTKIESYDRDVYIVDSFIDVNESNKKSTIYDGNFNCLYDVLNERGKQYYCVPVFYNSNSLISLYNFFNNSR